MEGMNFPRVTTIQRNAIPTPTTDLVVFNVDTNGHETWDGSTWVAFGAGGGGGGSTFLARYNLGPQAVSGAATNTIIFQTAEQDSDSMLGTPGDGFLTFTNAGTYVIHLICNLTQSGNSTAEVRILINGSLAPGQAFSPLGMNPGNPGYVSLTASITVIATDILTVTLQLPTNASNVQSGSRLFIQKIQAVGGGGGGSGYDTVEEEGSALTQRTTIDFQGAGVTATDDGAQTVVTIPGGGGGSANQTTRISRTTTQALSTGVPTDVIWEVEDVDQDNQFLIGNPTQIVISTTGEYLIGMTLFLSGSSFDWQWFLNVNGTSIDQETFVNSSTTTKDTRWTLNRRSTTQFSLTAGDIITVRILPNVPSLSVIAKSKLWVTSI